MVELRTWFRGLGRRRAALFVAGVAAWSIPFLWCVVTFFEVHAIRGDVNEDVVWMMKVDRTRARVTELTSAALDDGAAPAAAPDQLVRSIDDLRRGAETNEWHARGRAWVAAFAGERSGLARADRRFNRATTDLVRRVRMRNSARSAKLSRIWSLASVLGVLTIAVAGALLYLFLRTRAQALALGHAKLALEESERRMRAVYSMPPDMVWAVDEAGCWTYLSEGVQELYGYHPEEMIGQPFDDFVAPEAADTGRLGDPAALEGRFRFRTTHVGGDGRRIELLMGVTPMRHKSGGIIGATGTAMDVSGLERSERAG